MVIDSKEINPDRMADALEMLTNNYTRSQEIKHDYMVKYGNLLMDYADLKKKHEELKTKYEIMESQIEPNGF